MIQNGVSILETHFVWLKYQLITDVNENKLTQTACAWKCVWKFWNISQKQMSILSSSPREGGIFEDILLWEFWVICMLKMLKVITRVTWGLRGGRGTVDTSVDAFETVAFGGYSACYKVKKSEGVAVHAVRACRGEKRYGSSRLNLGTRWRRVVIIRSRPFTVCTCWS